MLPQYLAMHNSILFLHTFTCMRVVCKKESIILFSFVQVIFIHFAEIGSDLGSIIFIEINKMDKEVQLIETLMILTSYENTADFIAQPARPINIFTYFKFYLQ